MTDLAALVLALPDECDACRAKPGAPILCALCLAVRALKGKAPSSARELDAFRAVVEAAKGLCGAVDDVAATGTIAVEHPIFMGLLKLGKSVNELNRVLGE